MTNLEFSSAHSYRYDSGDTLAPLLPIRLKIGEYSADFLVLVDTGAERTLLEGVHARAAGLDIFDGTPLTFQGFLGARTVAYLHRVRVVIEDIEVAAEVAFSTQPLARQVLGRDLLAFVKLGVRERASEFYLASEE